MRHVLFTFYFLGRSWPGRLAAPNRETTQGIRVPKPQPPTVAVPTPLPPVNVPMPDVVGAPTRTPSGLHTSK